MQHYTTQTVLLERAGGNKDVSIPSKNSYEFSWEWVVKLNRLDLIEVTNEFVFEQEL